MFKLSLITDEVSQDLNEAVELAKRHSLQAVEIRSVWNKSPFELTREDISSVKSITDNAGLPVCCISSPFFKCELGNEEETAANIEGLKRCIEYAKELECGLIRGFTFWAQGSIDENLEKICSEFQEPIRLLEGTGITLALEFDPSTYATNGKKIARVVNRINSPYVKILWDPGNDIYEPDFEVPYPDGYNQVRGSIAHIHLKDAVRCGDSADGVAMCRGQVDYAGQFRQLIRDDYSGYLSLETHYRKNAALSEELLQRPGGSDFSAFGYESSDECLVNIAELLRSL